MAALLDDAAAADAVFDQANNMFDASHVKDPPLTPGKLLAQMQLTNAPEIGSAFPAVFLCLDIDGVGTVSRAKLRAGFARFGRPNGLSLKMGGGVPEKKSSADLAQLEEQATKLLQPKIDGLKACFDLMDIDKSGTINARKLAAFQKTMAKSIQREAEAAEAEAAAAAPPPKKGDAPIPPPTASARVDGKTQAMLQLDLHASLAELQAARSKVLGGGAAKAAAAAPAPALDPDSIELDFAQFRSLLARHASALEGAGGGGGKKGKKKK